MSLLLPVNIDNFTQKFSPTDKTHTIEKEIEENYHSRMDFRV